MRMTLGQIFDDEKDITCKDYLLQLVNQSKFSIYCETLTKVKSSHLVHFLIWIQNKPNKYYEAICIELDSRGDNNENDRK